MMLTRSRRTDRSHAGGAAGRAGGTGGTGLGSARSRFERRALAARRRPRLLAGIGVGLLLLVGLLAWAGWYSPLLTADRVEVAGVSAAQAAQVRRLADVPLGGPLLRVDTDAAVARVESDRQWKDVTVERALPHTVRISVTPREPALAVRLGSGEVQVVDREGVVLRTADAAPKGVPLVTSGAQQVTPEGVTAARQALSSLDKGLQKEVSGVSVSAADQVTFSLTVKGTKRTVVWGGPGEAATKARLVAILVKESTGTIDVSVPSSPVTR